MIGRLHGILKSKQPPWLLVDVHGVGYELEASMETFLALPELEQQVTLFTHLAIRDDAHLLYGFIDDFERRLFRELIRINGVGPRMALAILSGMERQQLLRCLLEEDAAALMHLPGVGKKTASRLIIELRDRLQRWPELQNNAQDQKQALTSLLGQDALKTPQRRSHYADAEAALIALGYKPTEAARMLNLVDCELPTEQLIKAALSAKR